ncbi:hypothetical protein COLO4_37994 [Corchorus olitorius]|uniref:Malectin-like domain-containing protein n=1 Tax=Corchorus olitorius TaxID=93759 RepID=A0A1R3FXM4_9ROSI|nr:hypothetical protein COLO4_37994 [Corchorus olitorius]
MPLQVMPPITYITSRVSYSEFTYMIPLTAGPKFIRLHFDLTSHPGFDLSKAYFSVNAGPFTLLTNFSALLHAQGQPTLVKEFCVVVEDGQSLNITFTPSSAMSDAYAFINGIEIVSMPTNLYYGAPANENGIPFLGFGQGSMYSLENSTALETMHRINTGGADIPPANDTGMYRAWSTDDNYLAIAEPSFIPINTSINLNFSDQPSFVAPDVIYRKARTMGQDKTVNENYHLTWEFSVDSGFNYLLSEKSDVYSFGVVLFEVLCARAPIDRTRDHTQISLAEWAKHCTDNGTLDQIIDPYLQGKISTLSLLKFGEVAISCLASEGVKRPAMSEVVYGLELALQLQESTEINANDENHLHDSTIGDYHVLFTSGSGSMNIGR